ncbi:uncharacterized protein Dana_GF11025 [Drosophila ananassae]|uniref:Craniofacial development protein 1 n=1 Tax=Drosophila ananassae TaxID=7217 RepID=B3MBR1_DROAN|nr:craniofacial development protein 1 [Drosophila ananassae]EDV38207.2 uncharacterized protein Dana_GF11025 [Drosophila ananassae]
MSVNDEKAVDSDEDYCIEGDCDAKSSENSDTSSDESDGSEVKEKKNISSFIHQDGEGSSPTSRKTRQAKGSKQKFKNDKDELHSDEEADKSRSNALWADFLNDVGSTTETQQRNPTVIQKKIPVETRSSGLQKNVNMTEEGLSSKKNIEKRAVKRPTGLGGVGSFINILGKKKKMSVLEKSQMDWNTFKSDEGIDEELRTHNKGKEGYLDRQDFLQRTDMRQFEIEKSLRQSRRKK